MTSTISENPSSAAEQGHLYSPAITLSENIVLQPPLSQPVGAGILIFLPSPDRFRLNPTSTTTSDPDPLVKWAKEGFAVVAVTDYDGLAVAETLKQGLNALNNLEIVSVKDKFAVIGERFSSIHE